jgi:UDP-glucose 4-epimerase
VVTGGAGFIGAHLSKTLSERGHSVVVVDDLSTGSLDNLAGCAVETMEGTILSPPLLDTAMHAADAVVHLAAIPSVPRSVANPVASHHANATGTLEVLEAARRAGIGQVVLASSSSVYGASTVMPKHEGLPTAPRSPYAVSKLATETYAIAYHHCYGLGVLPFRFFNVFGPLQAAGHAYAAVIPAFVDAALDGRPLPLQGDGTQSRDFTYVGTVVRVIAEAVERSVTSAEPVNLAFGGRTSLNELIGHLEVILERPLERDSLPVREGDVPHSQAAPDRLLGLFPDVTPVPLEDGVRETVRWFQTQRGAVVA